MAAGSKDVSDLKALHMLGDSLRKWDAFRRVIGSDDPELRAELARAVLTALAEYGPTVLGVLARTTVHKCFGRRRWWSSYRLLRFWSTEQVSCRELEASDFYWAGASREWRELLLIVDVASRAAAASRETAGHAEEGGGEERLGSLGRKSQEPEATGRRPLPPARHSEDWRSVHWYGTDYHFTRTQAACVKVLWEAWENGTPERDQARILEHHDVEAESKRLIDLFKNHPAWGKMIVKGRTSGAYRLAEPQ